MDANEKTQMQRLRLRASLTEAFMTLTKYLAGVAVTATALTIGYEGSQAAMLCVIVGLCYAIVNFIDTWHSWL